MKKYTITVIPTGEQAIDDFLDSFGKHLYALKIGEAKNLTTDQRIEKAEQAKALKKEIAKSKKELNALLITTQLTQQKLHDLTTKIADVPEVVKSELLETIQHQITRLTRLKESI